MPLSPHPQRPAFLLIWIGLVTGASGMVGNVFLLDASKLASDDLNSAVGVLAPLDIQEKSATQEQPTPTPKSVQAVSFLSLPENQIRASDPQGEATAFPKEELVQAHEAALNTLISVVGQPRFPSWYRTSSSANGQNIGLASYADSFFLDDSEDQSNSGGSGPSLRIQRAKNGLAWFMATFQAETPEELYFQMKGFLADLPEASRARIKEDLEDEGSDEGPPRARARAVLRELNRHGMFELAAQMTPEQARQLLTRLRARRLG